MQILLHGRICGVSAWSWESAPRGQAEESSQTDGSFAEGRDGFEPVTDPELARDGLDGIDTIMRSMLDTIFQDPADLLI